MKQSSQTSKTAPVIDNSVDNFVGNTDMRKNRSQALNVLNKAKEIEAEKLRNGYRWVIDGKTCILHKPDNA